MHIAQEPRPVGNRSSSDNEPCLYDILSKSNSNSNGPTAPQRKGKKPQGKLSTAEARREYQRRYYQMHKEQAREYQRQYNLTHKKKARLGRGTSKNVASREVVRATFNTQDIQGSPMGQTWKILEKIIKGERLFTM